MRQRVAFVGQQLERDPRGRPRRRQSAAVPREMRDPCSCQGRLRPQRFRLELPQRSGVSIIRASGRSEVSWRTRKSLPSSVSRGHRHRADRRGRGRAGASRAAVAGARPAPRTADHADRERREAHARGRRSLDAGRGAARSPRADRHQDRLRPRRVRRVHGAARRQAGLLVQPARGVGRRPRRSDGRRARMATIRCSRRSSSTTRRSAASARPVS